MENNYDVCLVNNQGCNFDNASFTNLEIAKKWASDRGSNYTAYFRKNYDSENNYVEEEFSIDY